MSTPRTTGFLQWPLVLEGGAPKTCGRARLVRQQIEQVLFTLPGERPFRPHFGAGVERLVFEPNGTPLWEISRHRIHSAVTEALRGEAAPGSVQVELISQDETLQVVVRYTLAAIQQDEEIRHSIRAPGGTP